jgi:hypothetical protein
MRIKSLVDPMKILWGTTVTLGLGAALSLAAAPACAQGAAAGPMVPATPSDRPIDQTEPVAKARPMTIGDKPNLSGSWVLNKDQSDDARKAIEDARGSSGQNGNGQPRWGGGGPGGGGGGWGHGQGNPGGNGGGGGRRGQNANGGANPFDELSQLTIDQTPSSINVTGVTGRVLASSPAASQSQQKSSNSDSSGETASAPPPPTVEWKNSQLVVTEPQGRRGTTTRTFELSPDGRQLYVTTTIDNPRFKNPATIRFVYDPASSGE